MISRWSLRLVGMPPSSVRPLREATEFWEKHDRDIRIIAVYNTPPIPKDEEAQFVYENSWGGKLGNILFWTDWERFSPGVGYYEQQVIVIYTKGRWSFFLPDVLIHEFGHIFGLDHCSSPFCVMSKWGSPGMLPLFRRLCGSHKKQLGEMEND